MPDQKSLVNELAGEFAKSILSSANHNKEVLEPLEIEIPDKNMFYINLVLWESWMFFVALGKVNPPQGEEILSKTHVQIGSSLQKITMERFTYLAQQLYPIFSQAFTGSDDIDLPTILSQMLFGEDIIIEGFQDYIEKLTSATIDSHIKTIQGVFGE
ncbi:MAG: hypothetical protein GQ561_02250 [Calditrichae bacterium]|nr:hypothetical protein [Calditrichia bacterium]